MDLPRYHTCASPPTCRIYVHPFRNSFGLIDRRRLSRDKRLTYDSCSSGWCFVIGFLHRSRCLPRLAELLVLPLFGRTADFHRIDTCALLGAQRKPPQTEICGGSYREPGDDLLSLEIQPTIIGAEAFHCPVRNGKEWDRHAMVTRLKKGGKVKHSSFGAAMQSPSNSLEVFFELPVQGFTVIGSSFTSN